MSLIPDKKGEEKLIYIKTMIKSTDEAVIEYKLLN